MPRRFRRRRPMSAPVVSFKHQHAQITSYIGGNANEEFVILAGTNQVAPVSPTTAPIGHKMYSVDVTVNFVNGSANNASDWSWAIYHLRQDQTIVGLFGAQASNWSSIGVSSTKNQCFESHMGTISTEDGSMYNREKHVKIPKQWFRIRDGDQLILVWNSAQGGILALGARFKSYS